MYRNTSSTQTGSPAILVVEDEPMIGIDLVDIISEGGRKAIGPFGSVETAKSAIANVHVDGAIVDVNLNGELSFEVANLLAAAGIPFLFYTGMDPRRMPVRHRNVPCLPKPSAGAEVVDRLVALLQVGLAHRALVTD